jgi:hypothetical protein
VKNRSEKPGREISQHPECAVDSAHLPDNGQKPLGFARSTIPGLCQAPARNPQEYPGFRQQKSRIE